MTKASCRIQPVADTLLQDFGLGKATVDFAVPDDLALISDLKGSAGAWNEGDFAEISSKGREKLLSKPGRAQKPLALRAIGDGDPRS